MKALKGISLLLSLTLLLSITCAAQDTAKGKQPIRHRLPTPLPLFPRYPGGSDSLAAFIKAHTRYPKAAKKNNISGVIEVDFTVTIDGKVKDPKVVNPLGYGCDEEALRVVKLLPKYVPGRVGNTNIELSSHVNIPFGQQQK
jgi:periplasmic protein TonB